MEPNELGTATGESVSIEVDYAIIRHFSEHLYGSPNKAVEELVSNGYDALATECRVYIPGSLTDSSVLVWDSGHSMDIAALKELWVIARSPKAGVLDRVAESNGMKRFMIGKFGIGKLASYALGDRITHYCHLDGKYYSVTVDYRELIPESEFAPEPAEGDCDSSAKESVSSVQEDLSSVGARRYETPIKELTKDEARDQISSLFQNEPKEFGVLFERGSWTLAAIDRLKAVNITPGRLAWVLGNSMPLRPDFRLFVNDSEVKSRLSAGAKEIWNFSEPQLAATLKTAWREAASSTDLRQHVEGEVSFATAADGVAEMLMPNLGAVRGEVRVFSDSLLSNDPDKPRSYGFFIMVRGRLINADDPLLLLSDPSYTTFYRCQFVIHADGLDPDLLADRERIKGETIRGRELAVVQRAMYRAARAELDRLDAATTFSASTESMLPVESRELFREPLTSLLMNRGGDSGGFSLSAPTVTRIGRDPDAMLSDIGDESQGFIVNSAHPFYASVASRVGRGKKAAEILRVLDLFAISERLLEGRLYDGGMTKSEVDRVMAWRDMLFRALAVHYGGVTQELMNDIREASYLGQERFEEALAKLFQTMGFLAERDGKSGKKDILVVAPVGPNHQRFTLEAKGSKHAVANDQTDLDIAAAHRTETGATHSIVVAREFSGFASGKDNPMVLNQLREVKDVSIVTVDVLIELAVAVQRFSYPLETILPVLMQIESPSDKLLRVQSLSDPLQFFDIRKLLDSIWARQNGEAAGDVVAARHLWQTEYKAEMTFDEFRNKVMAIETISDALVNFKAEQNEVYIRQSPENVIARIERSLGLVESE